jgi:NAD(P)-dependent dehydrogenase (short-subunit alcohol dehydrogenase family)
MPEKEPLMHGKVTVITGTTSGIGEVTARALAEAGGTVVMVCRSPEKGAAVQAAIKKDTGNQNIEIVLADFESLASVRQAAAEIESRWSRLVVLVNNAGAIQTARSTTKDGIETTFQVNHLAPFLLTSLLLPRLRQSAPSRIVNVASRAHLRGGFDIDDLESKKGYHGFVVYCRSKLCNVLFTYELARRLEGTGVTVNCLHPGVIASGFGHNRPGLFRLGVRLAAPFMLTPERGARTSIYLATSPEVAGVTGKYFDDDATEKKSSRLSYDRDLQSRLWEISEQMTSVASRAAE